MRLVLDASVTLSLALPDEKELGDIVLSELKNGQALVPALWWYEVRNALIIKRTPPAIDGQRNVGGFASAGSTADSDGPQP